MADVLTPTQRSRCMSCIRSKNTKPEILVRSMLHRMGFRFRLHRKDLPGRPDIVLPRYRAVVLVHGCFWHKHRCKYGRVTPKTNATFWEDKRNANVERDKKNILALRRKGWRVLVIWECWLSSPLKVEQRIRSFL